MTTPVSTTPGAAVLRPDIEVTGVGVRFIRNRGGRRTFKELFSSKRQRISPDEFWALKDVSFTVHPGEAIGVVGRNGHGKSTLLKIVAGVLIPDTGTVQVNDGVAPLIEITGGFVDELTVRDNIYLTAGLHGMSRKQVDGRFRDIVEFAEIEPFLDTPYKHLSSGMKVRVAFSVITQLDEPIIIVDEVLAVGDRGFREKCYGRIEELLAAGRTLFFVSHSENDLRRFCTRGLYLKFGELIMDAPIDEVLDQYNEDYNTKKKRRDADVETGSDPGTDPDGL